MLGDGADHVSAEKSFRIKQDDGFFSKLMAKETSMANSSSRVFYYGETSVAVAFMWEAQPGTPKHPLSQNSLQPPLTPPPSYYSNSKSNAKRRNSKANIFSSILPGFIAGSRKAHVSPSSSSSSSWSLSDLSPSFSMRDKDQGSLSLSRSGSTISSSTQCSSLKHKCSNRFKGCYPFRNMKNANCKPWSRLIN